MLSRIMLGLGYLNVVLEFALGIGCLVTAGSAITWAIMGLNMFRTICLDFALASLILAVLVSMIVVLIALYLHFSNNSVDK